jgi:hypothetical protein
MKKKITLYPIIRDFFIFYYPLVVVKMKFLTLNIKT